ncbi:putative Transcriptional regulator, IclR family [Mesorhizobium metallidurans STM 2683]|uniref:Putative Transcriptional regulator, IclR family n=1 Tax=Mesorhizobium metallidurans STM 2683 TaxID=1297569 RepID=M5ENT8_9HYPH|nr:IclR family transcriptional regulator C-terminal domain-containing protein [Mesorhizobium metallidurans]CCV06374.1 putative Transcriptional regulator, IclR family [Mesorhizobium metallidurans STM 2683]
MSGPLARYVEVLEVISQSSAGLSLTDICELTGLHKATASRLLKALLDSNLVAQTHDSRRLHTAGVRLRSLVRNAISAQLAGGSFLKEMESLSKVSQLTAMLAKLSKGRVTIISLAFPDPTVPYVHPGPLERPILTCSLARAILAYQDDEYIRKVLQRETRMAIAATGSPTANRSSEKLQEVRDTGASICDEELQAGITSVAVPIQVEPYGTIGSIGLVGFTQEYNKKGSKEYIDLLRNTKTQIENKISIIGNEGELRNVVEMAWNEL